jgi:hypothetical protein
MRRLTAPDRAGGPSACVFPNPAELNARDDAGGGGAFGARPLARIPNIDIRENLFKITEVNLNILI